MNQTLCNIKYSYDSQVIVHIYLYCNKNYNIEKYHNINKKSVIE